MSRCTDLENFAARLEIGSLEEVCALKETHGNNLGWGGIPAIWFAAANPDPRVVKLFMDSDIDDYTCERVYQNAIRNANSQILATLLESGMTIVKPTILMQLAIELEHIVHFEMLLPHVPAEAVLSVFGYAVALEATAIVWCILKLGFSICKGNPGGTAWILCRTINLLINHVTNRAELVQTIGRCIPHYNVVDRYTDNTVCHGFSDTDSARSLAFVIQQGADVHLRNRLGRLPNDVRKDNVIDMQRYFSSQLVFCLAGAECVDTNPFSVDLYAGNWHGETKEQIMAFANQIVQVVGVDICIGLQSLDLPALVTCEILQAYCHMWPRIPFHCYWNLVVAIKHFRPNALPAKPSTSE